MNKKNQLGKAIFEIQRFQILQAKINPNTSSLIPDSLAFAWGRRLYSIHDESAIEINLEEHFAIKKDRVEEILERATSKYEKKENDTFYEYEKYYDRKYGQGKYKSSRKMLIVSFRYFLLHGYFDNDNDNSFWKKLFESCPSEGRYIKQDFEIKEISLVPISSFNFS